MRSISFILLAACALSPTGSCNIVTPAAYALFGPGKIDAEHVLTPARTVVFVDDRQNILPRTVLRSTVGEQVSTDLLTKGVVPSAVEPRQAITLTRQKEGGANPMSIAAIGRELECQQVLYVQVTSFTLAGDGSFSSTAGSTGAGATPTAKATVKVIDVVNNSRTYPIGEDGGREVVATIREIDPGQMRTVAQRRAIEDKLAAKLGDSIAKLFYEHDRVNLGENLGPRSK